MVRGDLAAFDRTFTSSIEIGRAVQCQVHLAVPMVSRVHAAVTLEDGRWILRDRGSTNGVFVDGKRVQELVLAQPTEARMGADGPVLRFSPTQEERASPPVLPVAETTAILSETRRHPVQRAPKAEPAPPTARSKPAEPSKTRRPAAPSAEAPRGSLDDYIRHYAGSEGSAGEHTQMIRLAVKTVQRRQRRFYGALIAVIACAAVGAGGFAYWKHLETTRQREAATALFDQLKEMDLQIAQVKAVVESTGNARINVQLEKLSESRARLSRRYEAFVQELKLLDGLTDEERTIYRVARAFNESELTMPKTFVRSVLQTIREYWQTPAGRNRFKLAIDRAKGHGQIMTIAATLKRYGLTPRFLYLGLQESNLNTRAVGPLTRWGRAKGMWQFIPSTARRFGLNPGQSADAEGFDPTDERHDFEKASRAAAQYLQSIYTTLAQASGLLVVASYNWGEHRVSTKLDDLPGPQAIPSGAFEGVPEDPRARCYWRFLSEYSSRMPDETKDYVLKIFSAAVIGENPRLFGFDMDNPLKLYLDDVDRSPSG